jgi:osmotically-inducible protein OsmY
MRTVFALFVAAVAVYACSREEPARGQPGAQAPIEETRQVEKAAEAGKPLDGGNAAKPLSDNSLTQIVKSALQSESSLDAGKIDVENRGGNVALHGSVGSEEQKEKAGRIVGSVGGVRNVTNNLTVDPSASTGGTAGVPTSPSAPPLTPPSGSPPPRLDK